MCLICTKSELGFVLSNPKTHLSEAEFQPRAFSDSAMLAASLLPSAFGSSSSAGMFSASADLPTLPPEFYSPKVVQQPFKFPMDIEMFHSATIARKDSLAGIAAATEKSGAATIAQDSLAGIVAATDDEPVAATITQDSLAGIAAATEELVAATIVSKDSLAGIAATEEVEVSRQSRKPARCVRFADDCGQCLETVRVMTEPSDYPPKISPTVLRRFRRAAAAAFAAQCISDSVLPDSMANMAIDEEEDSNDDQNQKPLRCNWVMAFRQPASEYVRFREALDRQKVALENVILRNELGRMIGTIKVANIAYEKRVFLRLTTDGWATHGDHEAKWQSSPSKAFDTFRFDVELPRNESPNYRIEFCVCFVSGPASSCTEHWDSNDGKNFTLISSKTIC